MTNACTIIARNFQAAARVLAESFFSHHPDSSFTVLVVDDEQREIALDADVDSRIVWWRLSDLGLDTAEIHTLAAIYDVIELCTAVKPLFLHTLMRARESSVVYLDPDIRVFGSIACAADLADEHGLVLTPHITQPIPHDGRGVDVRAVLAAGVYNLGFAAVGPSAAPCLRWWWEQTQRWALNDVEQQMFTDQRWADYMPSLFSVHLLKDPGFNVAYWNLHERPLSCVNGRIYARNAPLRFFHFSGFRRTKPWLLSVHQGQMPRILLSEHPVLAELCAEYAGALDLAGFGATNQQPYGWGVSAGGIKMTRRIRRMYWSAVIAAGRGEGPAPPDAFDAESPEALSRWLNEPDERGLRRWSRYLSAIYGARFDLRAHMPDVDGRDATAFRHWIRDYGVVEEEIDPVLMPPDPNTRTQGVTAVEADESPPPEGLNIVGYFHAEVGTGEAARLLTRAIAATPSAYKTIAQPAALSRQRHQFDTGEARTGVPFDVNLLCMNADVTPAFARNVGDEFFAGRYTIGYWFWEVEPLPPAMHAAFDHVDEIWTATEYVRDILTTAAAGRTPIFTVPLPLAVLRTQPVCTRADVGFPADRFVFLFVFDFLSEMNRKNPLGLIDAFCAAFAPEEGPLLVIKTINGDRRTSELERLRHAAAHRSDIVIRDGYVSAEDKNALVAACDCYVSLHRAEGLGLTLAEAIAAGKPTIATGYSGNCHFMSHENSFLIDYTMTRVSADGGPYPRDGWWAEPSVAHAAELMRTVYEHPDEGKRRAERASSDLLRYHDVAASASAIWNRLSEIRRLRSAEVCSDTTAMTVEPDSVAVDARPVVNDTPAPLATADSDASRTVDPIDRSAAAAAHLTFAAALPTLRELGQPRLSSDHRRWPRMRHIVQKALFRILRPYWNQQRQFQEALLDTLNKSFERLDRPPQESTAAPAPSGHEDRVDSIARSAD